MKATKYIGIVASLLLLVIIPVTLLATKGDKNVSTKAASFNDVTVFLSPAALDVSRGTPFDLKVSVSTGKNGISSADVVITYDPQMLVLTASSHNEQSFKAGSAEGTDGKATVHVEGGLIGDNNLAKLTFHPLKRGTTEIAVSEETSILASGGGKPIPYLNYSAQINIR